MSASRVRGVAGRVAVYGLLAVVTTAALGPSLWVVLSSFKTSPQVFSAKGLLPAPFSVQGYVDVFTDVHLERHIVNSALYAGGGTLGALIAGLFAAYPLARFEFRGRNALVAAFSLALAIPIVGLATPEFFVVRELGLLDTKQGMVVFYSALMFPLTFVILRAFLVSLPNEVEEAAMVDGASYFTIVWKIVIPLSRPALATAAVVAFVTIWNEFFFANLLAPSLENENAQQALAAFQSQFGFNVSATLAGASIVMLVPVLVFLTLQRQVIAGLTAGTTK